MIKYDRASVPVPKGLLRAGRLELARNLNSLRKNTELVFRAYSSAEVKEQLKALFGRKCVFCESLLLGTQPGDIEHYRPKGGVVIPDPAGGKAIRKPGYYWLAANWSNLLLACADCNRPRTQADEDALDRVFGKANYFPISDETLRAISGNAIVKEMPLILDPCIDDPGDHLIFGDDGRVQPSIIAGVVSAKGKATIYFCGLARAELLQMRARHRRTVMAAIRHIVNAISLGNDPGADLDDITQMLDPKEPYVAYTRLLVRTHLAPYLQGLGLGPL